LLNLKTSTKNKRQNIEQEQQRVAVMDPATRISFCSPGVVAHYATVSAAAAAYTAAIGNLLIKN